MSCSWKLVPEHPAWALETCGIVGHSGGSSRHGRRGVAWERVRAGESSTSATRTFLWTVWNCGSSLELVRLRCSAVLADRLGSRPLSTRETICPEDADHTHQGGSSEGCSHDHGRDERLGTTLKKGLAFCRGRRGRSFGLSACVCTCCREERAQRCLCVDCQGKDRGPYAQRVGRARPAERCVWMKLHSDEAGGDGACLTDAQMVVQVQGMRRQGKANRRGVWRAGGPPACWARPRPLGLHLSTSRLQL